MITLKNVSKVYQSQKQAVVAIKQATIEVKPGEIYGVMGYSGAGKSTLIRMINGLETPSSGQVIVAGQDLQALTKQELLVLRRKIGMIFQTYNLLTTATVFQNVTLPLILEGINKKEATSRAEKYLKIVDLWQQRDRYPSELSGGQRQRVAIARALAHEPKILLSDEATSALDPDTTEAILELLLKINRELGITIFLITHEMDVIQRICDWVAVLDKGIIVEEGRVAEVFTQPKEEITKKFAGINETLGVPSEILKTYAGKGKLISLQFVGTSAKEPLLFEVQSKFSLQANILAGSLGYMKDFPYGRLLVQLIATDDNNYIQALDYIKNKGVHVEEVVVK